MDTLALKKELFCVLEKVLEVQFLNSANKTPRRILTTETLENTASMDDDHYCLLFELPCL